ncbi:MAG TPA: methyl-accepting chemotaxis protein [Ktedonobacteraceae bacterium]|nr:methyl-accepting chemotaxis protein [Ktedonobacteraceae bacterium]
MSERRPQGRFVPLRVRFRSPAEQAQWEREHAISAAAGNDGTAQFQPTNGNGSIETRQIKELLRLGNVLRAELGLSEVLQQMVATISNCTGFRIAVIHLAEEGSENLSPVAFTGMSENNQSVLREARRPIEEVVRLMRDDYRISQSYFIPHEYADNFSDIVSVTNKSVEDYVPGGWHPDDALIVPLFSPRIISGQEEKKQELLGFLSLDDPVDGKKPTQQSIEIAELFANQAAIAIDNARIFEEREAEHRALEEAIALLREDLEQIREGDLRVRVRSEHEKLQPIGEAINGLAATMSWILGDVQMVTQAVDDHTRDVQRSSELLVRDASQQEEHIHHISHVIDEVALTMHEVSEEAGKLSRVALEAMEASLDGQGAIDRAVEGMGQVREATMLSSRIMKRLGEGGQEINETLIAMSDLTTRMHLLALNTAIEATRAGEQGSGFTIIAQEMRSLATRSSEAAQKVSNHVRNIQYETTAVSRSVEQSTQQVVMQTELVMQTGVTLEAINVVTEQMANLIQGICNAADSQAQESQLVVDAIEQIKRMTGEITAHIYQMQQSLDHLVELTNSLSSRMSVFRVSP